MKRSRPAKRRPDGARGRKGTPWTGPAPPSLGKLPRVYLERAFAKLAEENARLRLEVLASSSLWRVAHQDPLTGLWNRRYTDERLAEEMSRSKREPGYRFSVVVVDVDNLKRINDQIGHAAGDDALRWVARFLREGLRLHDICGRLGGDEFLLILPACGEKDAHDFIARLNRRWHAAAERDGSIASLSIGSASYPTDGSTLPDLLAFCRRRDVRPEARPQSQPTGSQNGGSQLRPSQRLSGLKVLEQPGSAIKLGICAAAAAPSR